MADPCDRSESHRKYSFPDSYAATETIFGTSNIFAEFRSPKPQENSKLASYNVMTDALHSKM